MDSNYDGRADRVLRKLLEDGHLDEALELITTISEGKGNDITLAFRGLLINQGFESAAIEVGTASLYFHKRGYSLVIDPRIEGSDYFEHKTPELGKAFDQALVCIMRAGNIDAYIDDDGDIIPRGPIIADTGEKVDDLIGKFREEIDERFPDAPKRQGTWW